MNNASFYQPKATSWSWDLSGFAPTCVVFCTSRAPRMPLENSESPRNLLTHHSFGIQWPWMDIIQYAGWWFGCHFLFSHILGIIIPIDQYFSEGFKPPTRYGYTSFPEMPWKELAELSAAIKRLAKHRGQLSQFSPVAQRIRSNAANGSKSCRVAQNHPSH